MLLDTPYPLWYNNGRVGWQGRAGVRRNAATATLHVEAFFDHQSASPWSPGATLLHASRRPARFPIPGWSRDRRAP